MIDNSTYPEQMRHTAPGPRAPAPGPDRETHLAKKAPKMRLPIYSRHRIQLKQSDLKPHD
jgi:hypothetical protein